jgi:hypothetical protein
MGSRSGVEMRTRLHVLVHEYGLNEALDRDHFYDSIEEALDAIGPAAGTETNDGDERG